MKLSKTELKDLLQTAINRTQNAISEYESYKSQDTQTLVTHRSLIARKNTLEDVLEAINGNPVYLRILAGK